LIVRAISLSHLPDKALLRHLAALVAQDRASTVSLLTCIAEVDSRRLYRPAGYPSMYAYCVEELRLSEDAAYKRIQVARTAREFPALFTALADGRVHMTGVLTLAPHLTAGNVDELIAAATHHTRAEIEQWLARRFPRPEALRLDDGVSPLPRLAANQALPELAPERVEADREGSQLAPGRVPAPPTRVAPLSPERFALQITIDQETHDKLRYAQTLLGHALPSGDVALVLGRALDALIGQLEKRKFASTTRPRRKPRPAGGKRSVPAHVRRAVWERDRGECTFVGQNGHRCAARKFLEFDHVDPVALGGQPSVDRMRLRCRAHNQYEAERAFGVGFMRAKREQAAANRVAAIVGAGRDAAIVAAARGAATVGPERDHTADVIAGLRSLGVRGDEARRAAAFSETIHDGSLEERMRAALRSLARKPTRIVTNGPTREAQAMQHAP
jgi:hypothetical protein